MNIVFRWLIFVALVACTAIPAFGRQEQMFESLSNLVAEADYIVIAAIESRSSAMYMDGWVEYRCRFVYWLKAPMPPLARAQLQKLQPWVKADPLPLYKYEERGLWEWPPGAPKTNVVILVDSHEKFYHRLIPEGESRFVVAMAPVAAHPVSPNYQLLFLRADDKGCYVTVGPYQSILPVSPDLNVMKLPDEPHQQMDGRAPVKQSLEETVRFIVRDYLAYKKRELKWAEQDLQPVLKEK